jgi:tetratricopeptide (TPR) repeat protein
LQGKVNHMRKLISVFGRIPVSVFVLGIAAPTYYFYFHTCHRWSKETSYSCLLARVNRTLEETAEEIRRDPKNADAWYDRGKAHAWKGEYGYAWQAWGEYDRALAAFSEAVRLNPKDTDAWRARGEILLKKREYDLERLTKQRIVSHVGGSYGHGPIASSRRFVGVD